MKESFNTFELKTRYELCHWGDDKEPEDYLRYYDEFFESNFTCLVFQTPTKINVDPQNNERIEELENKIIFDKQFFMDEGNLKNAIDELNTIAPGKYTFIVFTINKNEYTPIYIDQHNIWHRLDIFPITEGFITENPCIWKSKEFGIGIDKPEGFKRSYSIVDYSVELEGRHPKTFRTQGIRITMNVHGYFMRLRIKLMYHKQAEIITNLFNSNLKVIYSKMVVNEP